MQQFIEKVNRMLGDAPAVLGGSGAKGTWLKNQHDADVFVLFPAKYKSDQKKYENRDCNCCKQTDDP